MKRSHITRRQNYIIDESEPLIKRAKVYHLMHSRDWVYFSKKQKREAEDLYGRVQGLGILIMDHMLDSVEAQDGAKVGPITYRDEYVIIETTITYDGTASIGVGSSIRCEPKELEHDVV